MIFALQLHLQFSIFLILFILECKKLKKIEINIFGIIYIKSSSLSKFIMFLYK